MKRYILILVALLSIQTIFAQQYTGTIKGTITEEANGEPIPFANVSLLNDTTEVLSTTSDFDGIFTLELIPAGKYSVVVTYVGFRPKKIEAVEVTLFKLVFLKVEMNKGIDIEEVVVFAERLIERDQTETGSSVSRAKIQQMAVRSVADITKIAGNGISSIDDGSGYTFVRGQRSGSSVTFIDGVKIIGTLGHELIETPVRHGNESYQKLADNVFQTPRKEPLSTFSIDVDKAAYANMRRFLNDGIMPPPEAVRIEELINYFDYDYPQPVSEHSFSITTELTNCPWNASRQLALIGIQGKRIDMEEAPKSNLVFLLDVSGSMNSADKLGLLKKGLGLLIDQLREEDRIAIVVYAGAAGVVLKSTKGDKKEEIKRVLNQLSAGGSTAGGAGIQLAYKIAEKNFIEGGNNRILLATDGDFNVGTSSQKALVELIEEKRAGGVFLSVLGFGNGNLQDYKMEQIANKGNGNYNYIDNILEAKKVLVNEMGGTLFTIAKDVKVQAEFNPAKVKAYRLIGYVNRVLEAEDFNDDKKDAGELGAGHTVTVLYEIIPAGSEEKITEIDKLKYQKEKVLESLSDELLTVKFRYKEPEGKKSILITKIMKDETVEFQESSHNLQFSAAVASFGMKLRKSESVKNMEYKDIKEIAKMAKGVDENGYRAEFLKLVQTAELIK
jgi:Ca-activated chloride channel family protein